jgi:hypothetical protein
MSQALVITQTAPAATDSGGGLPWWAWDLIALGVVGVFRRCPSAPSGAEGPDRSSIVGSEAGLSDELAGIDGGGQPPVVPFVLLGIGI